MIQMNQNDLFESCWVIYKEIQITISKELL